MAEVGGTSKLTVDLSANIKQYQSDLDRATEMTKAFREEAERPVELRATAASGIEAKLDVIIEYLDSIDKGITCLIEER